MDRRQNTLDCLGQLLERMVECHEHWQESEPGESSFLNASMLHDLEESRRLCQQLASMERLKIHTPEDPSSTSEGPYAEGPFFQLVEFLRSNNTFA